VSQNSETKDGYVVLGSVGSGAEKLGRVIKVSLRQLRLLSTNAAG
jgi:hypothetical protein